MKPFKGEIHEWKKVEGNSSTAGPIKDQIHLNYLIHGIPKGHPKFERFILTSAVVKFEEIPRHSNEPRKIEIETLNSRYHLIGEGAEL